MADAKLTFNADPTPGIASYTAFFVLTPAGGAAQPPVSVSVPRTPAGDASGYAQLYSALVPPPAALNDGDQVAATVESINTAGVASPAVASTPPSITISVAPPPPPAPTGPLNVGLAQV